MGGGQGRKADDGVHGRANIVGHVGQEHALGLAGPVCLGEGVLQQGFLLHFGPGLLVHAAKANHHAAAAVPVSGADGFHLEVAQFITAESAVVEVEGVPVGQLFPQGIHRDGLPQHFPVIFKDTGLDVPFHAGVKGHFAVKEGIQNTKRTSVGPERLAQPGIEIKKAHKIVVSGQGLNQVSVPAFSLDLYLSGAIQQEALVEQLAVFPDQLNIAHDMEQIAVGMPDPVLDIDTVSLSA